MKEGPVHHDRARPVHHQAAEIPQPGGGAFDLPAPSVTPQLPPLLPRRCDPVAPMGTDPRDAPPGQALAQRGRVTGVVTDHTLGVLARPSWPTAGHGHGGQGGSQPRHLGRGRRGQEVSQRKTSAADHHPPPRAFPPRGLAPLRAPFCAGAKRPSAQAAAHVSWPWASSRASKPRQAFSQPSCSSPSRRRRQQVLGEGDGGGKSFHRAPVRHIHKMPSKQRRLGVGLGPPRGDGLGSGHKGALLSHWASVSSASGRLIAVTPGAGHLYLRDSDSRSVAHHAL
jgi:hypothetical protein